MFKSRFEQIGDFNMRCKYSKQCKNFDSLNRSCTHDNGSYYSDGGKCGAYREFEKIENESN